MVSPASAAQQTPQREQRKRATATISSASDDPDSDFDDKPSSKKRIKKGKRTVSFERRVAQIHHLRSQLTRSPARPARKRRRRSPRQQRQHQRQPSQRGQRLQQRLRLLRLLPRVRLRSEANQNRRLHVKIAKLLFSFSLRQYAN